VNLRQQRAHLEIDVSEFQRHQRGRYLGQDSAFERRHQRVILGQDLFGLVGAQDGWRRKSFDAGKESIDIPAVT
jgi:hypothetical protein